MTQDSDSFEIDVDSAGKTLVVTGPWSEKAAQVMRSGDVDGLYLNYAKGFCEVDLRFFEEWPIRRLKILDRKLSDLDPIGKVASHLEEFSVEASAKARSDFIAMPQLRSLFGYWPNIRALSSSARSLESLSIYDFDESNILSLVDQPALKSLKIKLARRLQSLSGIAALRSLSVLGIHAAGVFEDLSELAESPPPLRELRLEMCARISNIDALGVLTDLQKLQIADCKKIESLAPLSNMRYLEALLAWGSTRIVDGDLSVLERLPLKELRMASRKEYRPSLEDVKRALGLE